MNIEKKYWAGGFLYNPVNNSVFLHKRDNNTKFNPNKWAFFGGLNEGDEKPIECFLRELKEEIGLDVDRQKIVHLCEYLNKELSTYRVVYYYISDVSEKQLTLGEGAGFGWIKVDTIDSYDLTEKTKIDIDLFLDHIKYTW